MTTYDQNMFLYWFTKTEEHSYAIVVGWMKLTSALSETSDT